ncbi:MAG: DUF1656 domain-containing protein [Hyphomicrobiales bacterium]|nr:DUF1656 domain-containing protein [Hyphomicrobiales bacterium]MBV8664444.1 DUF1656 domain-containing protein [Hyphomicrobiales bacterium]
MTNDINLYGVYLPALFAWALVAFAISVPVRLVLAWSGFYRFVFNPPLFDVALYVVLLGIVVLLTVVFLR